MRLRFKLALLCLFAGVPAASVIPPAAGGAFPAILVSANGASAPLHIQFPQNTYSNQVDFALGLIATVSSGASLTYTVQVTGDQNPTPGGNWNSHDVLVNQTASANSNVLYPVTAVRVVVSNYVSGSVNLGVAFWP